MARAVEYAGRMITLDELLDVRQEIERWAWARYGATDDARYRRIVQVCILAQGMWLRLSEEQTEDNRKEESGWECPF